jgi:hypothetical protein
VFFPPGTNKERRSHDRRFCFTGEHCRASVSDAVRWCFTAAAAVKQRSVFHAPYNDRKAPAEEQYVQVPNQPEDWLHRLPSWHEIPRQNRKQISFSKKGVGRRNPPGAFVFYIQKLRASRRIPVGERTPLACSVRPLAERLLNHSKLGFDYSEGCPAVFDVEVFGRRPKAARGARALPGLGYKILVHQPSRSDNG